MRHRYIIALTILGTYFFASYFILHAAIEQQRSMQRVISVSGQQRMYAQRIAMFADAIVARPDSALRKRARLDLETSIAIFSQAHAALTRGDSRINPQRWEPLTVERMFFARPYHIDRQIRSYLDHARALDERAKRAQIAPDDKDLDYLLTVGPGALLDSLDAIVAAYASEQRAAVATFESLQIGLLIFGLATLGFIWLAILLPMEREILRRTAEMERSAASDSLTRLLNRAAFGASVEASTTRGRRASDAGAMLTIDIDRFKTINDTYGHRVGDETIVRVAEIMRANSRANDVLARLGGDEFALFAPTFDSDTALLAFVERLCNALQFEIHVGASVHRVTASIGVVRFPADATTLRNLMAASDDALYVAKRNGRARVAFWQRPKPTTATDLAALREHARAT